MTSLGYKGTLLVVMTSIFLLTCSGKYVENQPETEETTTKAYEQPCGDGHCDCREKYYADCYKYGEATAFLPKLPRWVSSLRLDANSTLTGTLPDNFFANISHLPPNHLSLEYLNITNMSKGALDGLRQMRINILMITSCENLDVYTVRNLVSIPWFKSIHISKCSLRQLPVNLFENVWTSVDILDLKENDMSEVNMDVFVPLYTLETLVLSKNEIGSRITASKPIYIFDLYLDHNAMRKFPKTCDGENSFFPDLKYLYLSFNEITRILCKVCLPSLKQLDLTGNPFLFYDPGSFDDLNFPAVQRLIFWYPGTQGAPYLKQAKLFQNSHVEKINFDNSHFDFNDNQVVHETAFADCPRLKFLTLDDSNFEHVGEEKFLLLLGHLALKILSIQNSRITRLSRRMFSNFSDLETLNLSGNRIRVLLDGTFDDLPNLKSLYIFRNELTAIGEDTFGIRTRDRLIKLGLDTNPFVCDCNLRWFSGWLASNAKLFSNNAPTRDDNPFTIKSPEYNCNNMPVVAVPNFHMPLQACLLTREQNTMITAWSSLLLITFTAFTVVFGYRWHLRLLLYEVFRGRDDGVRQRRLRQNNFDYDVFLSYASQDLPWVQQHLLPQLEDRLGLKLCIHERDFIIGNNIVDNIAECVERSKKIMMVFSKYFLRSHWCQFELTYCLRHVMDYDDNLIIVCVDDVASREMTTAMMAVLKTTTYIQWAELGEAVQSFWGRLKIALNEIVVQV